MKKDKYFLIMSGILLGVTIIGFTPSFLFRPFYRDGSLPAYLIIHGIFLFLWFGAYFHQNWLVAKGHIINHKRNGMVWFGIAILVMLANLFVLKSISEEAILGMTAYSGLRTPENTGRLVLGTGYLVLTSTILFLVAYLKRHIGAIHKRAIFGASVILLGPAFDRFLRPFHVDLIHPLLQFTLINIFPLSLIIYDIIKRKRIHFMTIVFALLMILTIPIVFGLSSLGAGENLVHFLGRL